MIDSGAFRNLRVGQEVVSIEDYAQFLQTFYDRHLALAVTLDVIYDHFKTLRNTLWLRERVPLPILPVLHFDCPPELVRIYASEGFQTLGYGGIATKSFNLEVAKHFASLAEQVPYVRWHFFGCSRALPLHLFAAQVDSADTARWTIVTRFGGAKRPLFSQLRHLGILNSRVTRFLEACPPHIAGYFLGLAQLKYEIEEPMRRINPNFRLFFVAMPNTIQLLLRHRVHDFLELLQLTHDG